ncbi:hypothetical protein C8F01DRAFT_990161, partial [Mycena amicta]
WLPPAIVPIHQFIDLSTNPHEHYIDLVEIGQGRSGTLLAMARLSVENRDQLKLPSHVRERDRDDILSHRPTFVAIKIVPLRPPDSETLGTLRRELSLTIRCEHILGVDGLYLDPTLDTLWIRMEQMAIPLSRIVDLKRGGLPVLPDATVAGCIKDVSFFLSFLESYRV